MEQFPLFRHTGSDREWNNRPARWTVTPHTKRNKTDENGTVEQGASATNRIWKRSRGVPFQDPPRSRRAPRQLSPRRVVLYPAPCTPHPPVASPAQLSQPLRYGFDSLRRFATEYFFGNPTPLSPRKTCTNGRRPTVGIERPVQEAVRRHAVPRHGPTVSSPWVSSTHYRDFERALGHNA